MRIDDFFAGYTQQMSSAKRALEQGDFAKALSLVPDNNKSHNAYFLTLLEKGRLAFLNEDWVESQNWFELAYQEVQRQQGKAKLQLSKGVQNIGAMVSNDSALLYQIPTYEQSMLHTYQALNFLHQNKYEAALVEVRRANLVQESALLSYEDELYQAAEEMQKEGVSVEALAPHISTMNTLIGEVKNGFQNAYTFYLSALLYEASGELNDAYIDYKKALEIFPGNDYVLQDVVRLAKQLSMRDDLARFTNEMILEQEGANENTGQLVVLYEQGSINPRQEAKANLPIFTRHNDMRFYSFSLPTYRFSNEPKQGVRLQVKSKEYRSEEIVVLQSLATKQLTEQLPLMVTRQAFRLVAKEQVRRKLSKEGGDIGNILAGLYNIASERADTRSWLTLPNRIHLLKVNLPLGSNKLVLEHANGQSIVDVKVNRNRTTLVNLTTLGGYTGVNLINL